MKTMPLVFMHVAAIEQTLASLFSNVTKTEVS
jgi:hypothetical protein